MDRFTFLKMVKKSLETNDHFVAVGYTCNENLEKCNLSTFIWSGKKTCWETNILSKIASVTFVGTAAASFLYTTLFLIGHRVI